MVQQMNPFMRSCLSSTRKKSATKFENAILRLMDQKIDRLDPSEIPKRRMDFAKNTDLANAAYQKGLAAQLESNADEALRLLGDALLYAPPGSGVAALIHGLRAEISMKKEAYQSAVRDLRRAIDAMQPNVECDEHTDAIGKWKKMMVQGIKYLSKSTDEPHYEKQSLFAGENSLYYGVSSAIKMEYDALKGRKFVAVQEIPAGSLVLREIPVGWSVDPKFTTLLCQYCCDPLPIDWQACHSCNVSEIRYCSDICRDLAWDEYHKFECAYENGQQLNFAYKNCFQKDTIVDDDKVWINQRRASLRILLKTPIEELMQAQQFLREIAVEKNNNTNKASDFGTRAGDGFGSNMHSALSLMPLTITDQERRAAIEEIAKHLPAAYLMHPDWQKTSKNGMKHQQQSPTQLAAEMLLELQLRLARNAVSTHILTPDGQSEAKARGSGLYLLVAIFNHSCHPNIKRHSDGRLTEMRASRDIAVGEELCQTYGPRFGVASRSVRRKHLKSYYGFDCDCCACNEPQFAKLEREMYSYYCERCSASAHQTSESSDEIACECCSHVQSFTVDGVLVLMRKFQMQCATEPLSDETEKMRQQLLAYVHERSDFIKEVRLASAPTLYLRCASDAVTSLTDTLTLAKSHVGAQSWLLCPIYCMTLSILHVANETQLYNKTMREFVELLLVCFGPKGGRMWFTYRMPQHDINHYDALCTERGII